MKDVYWIYRHVSATVWTPAADIYENEKEIMVFIEMAGVGPDQVRISLENRSILITGERSSPCPGGVMRIHQMEIDAGMFRRRIPLPTSVDFDNIQCTYKNGLLRMVLPKRPERERIHIPVESE